MELFQGLFFLAIGIGLVYVVYQSLSRGWLPCGPDFFKGRLEFHRNKQPLLYWLMFVLYSAAGLYLTAFALRLLSGNAEPLPLS